MKNAILVLLKDPKDQVDRHVHWITDGLQRQGIPAKATKLNLDDPVDFKMACGAIVQFAGGRENLEELLNGREERQTQSFKQLLKEQGKEFWREIWLGTERARAERERKQNPA